MAAITQSFPLATADAVDNYFGTDFSSDVSRWPRCPLSECSCVASGRATKGRADARTLWHQVRFELESSGYDTNL
eukprot:scaffold55738_cov21-Tisochrysis_lutea.AAC.3